MLNFQIFYKEKKKCDYDWCSVASTKSQCLDCVIIIPLYHVNSDQVTLVQGDIMTVDESNVGVQH